MSGRAITLLAVSYCEQHGLPFTAEALTPGLLAELICCLVFEQVGIRTYAHTHIRTYAHAHTHMRMRIRVYAYAYA